MKPNIKKRRFNVWIYPKNHYPFKLKKIDGKIYREYLNVDMNYKIFPEPFKHSYELETNKNLLKYLKRKRRK